MVPEMLFYTDPVVLGTLSLNVGRLTRCGAVFDTIHRKSVDQGIKERTGDKERLP